LVIDCEVLIVDSIRKSACNILVAIPAMEGFPSLVDKIRAVRPDA
jgi:hypothetical protein